MKCALTHGTAFGLQCTCLCDEHKDDGDWMKCCITIKDDGTRDRDCLRKTWLDCVKEDMKSLGLSQQDEQSRNKWRRKIMGATG